MKIAIINLVAVTTAVNIPYDGRIVHTDSPYKACPISLDVLVLQDTTESFAEAFPGVRKDARIALDQASDMWGFSAVGVADFKDKPYPGVGSPDDYCFQVVEPIPLGANGSDPYSKLEISGGGDEGNSQYEAIINAFKSNATRWKPHGHNFLQADARLVILVTNSLPHFAGDSSEEYLPAQAQHVYDIDSNENDTDYQCKNMLYPSKAQVIQVIQSNPLQFFGVISGKQHNSTSDPWANLIEELGEPEGLYQYISSNGTYFFDGILHCLDAVVNRMCNVTATTTLPVSTALPESLSTDLPFTFASRNTEEGSVVTQSIDLTTPTMASTIRTQPPRTSSVTGVSTTPSTKYTSSRRSTSPTETKTSTTKVETSATQFQSTACSCPHPSCCKDGVEVKVDGRPKKIDLVIDYAQTA